MEESLGKEICSREKKNERNTSKTGYMCVNDRETGEKVKRERVEVVKVEEF